MKKVKKKQTPQNKRGITKESAYFDDFSRFTARVRKRIVQLREEKGLTQEEMQDFELNLRQFQRIESGETINLTLGNLYKIAKAFKMKPSELIDVL